MVRYRHVPTPTPSLLFPLYCELSNKAERKKKKKPLHSGASKIKTPTRHQKSTSAIWPILLLFPVKSTSMHVRLHFPLPQLEATSKAALSETAEVSMPGTLSFWLTISESPSQSVDTSINLIDKIQKKKIAPVWRRPKIKIFINVCINFCLYFLT